MSHVAQFEAFISEFLTVYQFILINVTTLILGLLM